jgi:nucleoside-specific outer membrane channel protein Tsx
MKGSIMKVINYVAKNERKSEIKLSRKWIGALLASCITTVAGAADWSDNYVGYRVGEKFREPCCGTTDIHKDILSFTHVSGYKYGINFFTADFLKSDSHDPAANGGGGAQEVYAVYRHQLLLTPVTGKSLAFGPVKEIALTAGIDLNSKDDAFGPRVRKFVVGPTFKFDVPGFFDVSLLYRTEHNHNGIVGKSVSFDPTYGVSLAWGIPIKAINAKFDGFLDHIGPKGKDGFGFETKAETLARAYLMFDAGKLAGKPDTFYAGIGYEYWNNKFGGNANNYGKTSAPMLALEMHF